ncbi:transcriptional regulator [Candidatus Shapirobacteria bacterium CG11_big_fil_rev_8_21_14_0_20_40_12]|uniref:Transcriptional regulator n=1 Tax=Candidatus Shapirobacteria bacterium CG11_big_fil_rev_8_21_14_0_20_40_12 TaxID=1974889 RepID=A0A2H0KH18_9BACT|nr:MAG: transcriptional regulator [Candidatus Shapirobacteria bacterium CG11_big_fil_rev_8_21_14_0_20_40_12]
MKTEKSNKEILNRLSYLEGHLRAVRRMVEEGKYCIDVIHQIEAVEAALKKVKEIILENHLNTCVTTAISGKNEKDRKRVLGELLEIFKKE